MSAVVALPYQTANVSHIHCHMHLHQTTNCLIKCPHEWQEVACFVAWTRLKRFCIYRVFSGDTPHNWCDLLVCVSKFIIRMNCWILTQLGKARVDTCLNCKIWCLWFMYSYDYIHTSHIAEAGQRYLSTMTSLLMTSYWWRSVSTEADDIINRVTAAVGYTISC